MDRPDGKGESMKYLLILLITTVILTSGCTQETQPTQNITTNQTSLPDYLDEALAELEATEDIENLPNNLTTTNQ